MPGRTATLILIFGCVARVLTEYQTSNHGLDKIETVDVGPTQVVITTTKEGPVDHLKIHIELTDLQDNKKMPPVDLNGLWLMISRGRYTIPFLKPDRWYGISFRSENIVNNRILSQTEERLVKTAPRPPPPTPYGIPPTVGVIADAAGAAHHGAVAATPGGTHGTPQSGAANGAAGGYDYEAQSHHSDHEQLHKKEHESGGSNTGHSSMYEVTLHRSLEVDHNLEGLYVTAKWLDHNRINNSELLVRVVVHCDTSNTREDIHLMSDEDSVTIEISMDHRYELEEVNKTAHQVKASISPLKCHKVCWNCSLVVPFGDTRFSQELGGKCEAIKGATSTTFLRNIKHYTVHETEHGEHELLVETMVGEAHEEGFVSLSALPLADNVSNVVYKTYSTHDSDGVFRLPLDSDAVYAVQYEYTKVKPFHYSAREHFIVETPAMNESRSSNPLISLAFLPSNLAISPEQKTRDPPTVTLQRGALYKGHKVTVHLEPFCEQNKSSEIVLDDMNPNHVIDVVQSLCSMESNMYFCDQKKNYTKCNSILCYSTSYSMSSDVYASDVRCTNVTSHFKLNSVDSLKVLPVLILFIVTMLMI